MFMDVDADGLLAGMSIEEVAAGWRRPAWSGRVPEPNKILHTIQVDPLSGLIVLISSVSFLLASSSKFFSS